MAVKMTKLSTLLLVIIIVLLGAVFILKPVRDSWTDLERRIEVVNLQYLRDSKTIDNYDEYIELFNKYEKISRQNRSDEEEFAFFLKEIEAFANNMALSIKDVKPLPQENEKRTNRFSLRLEMEGSIESIMNFFHNIASSETLIRVESYTIQTISRRNNILVAKVDISKTYLS